jgi:hypothetical protein
MARVRAVHAHRFPDRAPIRVHPGDQVAVGPSDDDWPAFSFVTTPEGSGWVPTRYLTSAAGGATVLRAYDTAELATTAGEVLDIVERDDESGWHRLRNAAGLEGWVPVRTLAELADQPTDEFRPPSPSVR